MNTLCATAIALTIGEHTLEGTYQGITPHPAYVIEMDGQTLHVPMAIVTECEGQGCVEIDQ